MYDVLWTERVRMPQGLRRNALREATSDSHARLDGMIGEWSDAGSYETYLKGTIRFRRRVEAAMRGAAWPVAWTWRPTMLEEHVLADAADLGLEVDPPAGGAAPPGDVSTLFGMLYVVEGSALGAKFLRRRAARLGFDDHFGARHLWAMAGATGWYHFLAELEASPDFDLPRATASASATFAAALDSFGDASLALA